MKRPPVAGFLRLSRLRMTGEICASVTLKAGLSCLKAATRLAAVRWPPIKRSASGSTVMLLAVGTKAVSALVY